MFLLSGHDLYKCKPGPRQGNRELIRNQIRGAIIINLSFQLRLKWDLICSATANCAQLAWSLACSTKDQWGPVGTSGDPGNNNIVLPPRLSIWPTLTTLTTQDLGEKRRPEPKRRFPSRIPNRESRERSQTHYEFLEIWKYIKLSLSWSANAFYLLDLCQLLNVVKSENFLNCWSSSLSMFGTRGFFLYLIQVIYHGHWLLILTQPSPTATAHNDT